jgi:uncharacterized protein YkwD
MHAGMPRRPTVLLVLGSLLLAAAPAAARERPHAAACSAAHVAVAKATVAQARDATLCLLNRARARAGLRPLRLNDKLASAAGRHSRDMVDRRYFSHASPNGTSCVQRMLDTHYVPPRTSWWLGENIGWGSATLAQPAALVRMWMHSPGHRANILDPHFRDIGIGIEPGVPVHGGHGGGATYTTDFGGHS